MKGFSTRSLFRTLDQLYALGLVATVWVVGNETLGDPQARQMTLLFAPILLTTLMFFGQYFVTRRETVVSQSEGRPAERAGHTWVAILGLYMVLAFVIWFWSGFDSSYTP
jgi:hypothetical protein